MPVIACSGRLIGIRADKISQSIEQVLVLVKHSGMPGRLG